MKKAIGVMTLGIPMPVVLVGTRFKGKANFTAVAWITQVNFTPAIIGIGLGKKHASTAAILKNKHFSINLPGQGMMEKVDYCGMVSGNKVDKSGIFETFTGKSEDAPMIAECPITMECTLTETVIMPSNTLLLGKVTEVYADSAVVVDGNLCVEKLKPFLLTMPGNRYWSLGKAIGNAWQCGKSVGK